MAKKCSVYEKLISDGWFENKEDTIPWIMAKKVFADDVLIKGGSQMIPVTAVIKVKEYYKKDYVNKGGLKLKGALDDFGITVENKICLDCGASTGGFTDCLILNGAQTVYAVDVGYGQLSAKLLHDPKVINLEKTNLSDEKLKSLSPSPELITLDLSYLSLKEAIPICEQLFSDYGEIIALVKPIFEVQSNIIRRTGDINEKDIHKQILSDLYIHFTENGYHIAGITNSKITGNNGTYEYFIKIVIDKTKTYEKINYINEIEIAVDKAFSLEKFKK